MVTARTHTQRATTWLCLAVAVLIALLPAGGAMVCLGRDGHVGFGAATTIAGCPCDQDTTSDATLPVADAQRSTDEGRHPPCDDFELDPPELYRDTWGTQARPDGLGDPSNDNAVSASFNAWKPHAAWPVESLPKRSPWTSAAGVLPRQQLEHKRVIVLLI